nr:MAG TPA: hypothetical protein [Crassvirales sp.]
MKSFTIPSKEPFKSKYNALYLHSSSYSSLVNNLQSVLYHTASCAFLIFSSIKFDIFIVNIYYFKSY